MVNSNYTRSSLSSCDARVYTHFSYGRAGSDIEYLDRCSIYRGSNFNFREDAADGYEYAGQIVEANRGRNIVLSQSDLEVCGTDVRVSGDRVTA